jgi:acyl transfer enzyme
MPMWRLRVEGRENLPAGACVLTPNHQSFLDIVVLFCLFYPFKWVARSELFRLPLFGWILRLGGYVSIQRGSSADAVRMLEDCGRLLEAGVPVLLFPEGTRSKSGVVGRFKAGAFLLSARHGVPIVPIAMRGALETVHNGRVRASRVVLRVRVLPAVPAPTTVDFVEPTRQAVEDAVREAVEGL